jgi:Tfp pilus assembly protein PilZ
VVTDLPERIGARVDFSLRLPEIDRTIQLSGTVCWIREVERREWQKRGFGIRFDSIAPEVFAQIRQTLTIRGVEVRGNDEP